MLIMVLIFEILFKYKYIFLKIVVLLLKAYSGFFEIRFKYKYTCFFVILIMALAFSISHLIDLPPVNFTGGKSIFLFSFFH